MVKNLTEIFENAVVLSYNRTETTTFLSCYSLIGAYYSIHQHFYRTMHLALLCKCKLATAQLLCALNFINPLTEDLHWKRQLRLSLSLYHVHAKKKVKS